MTNKEINLLVAEKVMEFCAKDLKLLKDHYEANNDPFTIWDVSSNITDAWYVVEKMDQLGWLCQMANNTIGKERFSAHFCLNKEFKSATAFSDSMPKAICIAALKAVGAEIK